MLAMVVTLDTSHAEMSSLNVYCDMNTESMLVIRPTSHKPIEGETTMV